MVVVLLTRDLMVVSRVEGAATGADATVRSAGDMQQAAELCDAEQAGILIVDLATPALEIESLVRQLQATADSPPKVIAFGPHVHAERLAAAREAGCDEVVSRGEFFARLGEILKQ